MKAEEIRRRAGELRDQFEMATEQVHALWEIARQLATLNELLLRLEKEMED